MSVETEDSDSDGGYAAGVLAHLEEFAAGRTGVLARFVLVNGESFHFERAAIRYTANVPGCVVLYGGEAPGEGSVIVREEHILYVELDQRVDEPPGALDFA